MKILTILILMLPAILGVIACAYLYSEGKDALFFLIVTFLMFVIGAGVSTDCEINKDNKE